MNGLTVIIPVKPPEPYLEVLTSKIRGWLYRIPHEIFIQTELGLTNAVIKGVEKSRYEAIAIMDADGSHDPKALLGMYSLLREHELVVGSKATGETEEPLIRRFISYMYRGLARTILDIEIGDPMSGYVMGRKYIFKTLKSSMDYKFLLQLLTSNRSVRVKEIPIIFGKRKSGKSKATLRTGLSTFSMIMRLWWKQS